ncbi:MAG: YggS family pyridoxal phosphate-dependent enzyme [Oscillospiraceae bacterium]|nr:YggS family pyridoxal phosphate-dependent enzyme [Oscillospiraceae bacterium]
MDDYEISENIKRIRYDVEEAKAKYRKPDETVRIMAVTKTVPYQRVNAAVNEGITLLGENRVQEYLEKKDFYDKKAEINFIGHLQSNKIKYIIDSVTMIHSVDSIRLASEIDRYAAKFGKCMDVLIEVNIGEEESKSGVLPDRLDELLGGVSELKNIRVKGLMSIPPIGKSEESFERLRRIFDDLKSAHYENTEMDILSAGMSADYVSAVKYGSNIVRIGSGIFGSRK